VNFISSLSDDDRIPVVYSAFEGDMNYDALNISSPELTLLYLHRSNGLTKELHKELSNVKHR
jgi:hypothetical protein